MMVLLFQIGDSRFGIDARAVKEVFPAINLDLVAGAPGWVAGVFSCRGDTTAVLDLPMLMTGNKCQVRLNTRIIMVDRPDDAGSSGPPRLLGLLVERLSEARRVDHPAVPIKAPAPDNPYSGPQFFDPAGSWQLVQPWELLPELDGLTLGDSVPARP